MKILEATQFDQENILKGIVKSHLPEKHFGCWIKYKNVNKNDGCPKGFVWFKKKKNKFVIYKTNYDTSD